MSSLTLYLLIVVSDVNERERERESANRKIFEQSLNNFITNFTDFMNFQSAHFEKKSLKIQLKDKHII
jgi:hypothetical protein